MRVAITGSAGCIGALLYKRLKSNGITVVGIDLPQPKPQGGPTVSGESVTCLDTVDYKCDLASAESIPSDIFKDCTHVVHLAAQGSADAPMEGPGGIMEANVVVTYNVLKLCEKAGVKRVVFASSNHVTHGHFIGKTGTGSLIDNGEKPRIQLQTPTLPDSFYGVSKVFGEELCKYYALIKQAFSAVCLRIGWCLYDDPSVLKGTPFESYIRSMWVSKRDCAEFFVRALDLEQVRQPFAVAYVLSSNSKSTICLKESADILGYEARDSSDTFFDARDVESDKQPVDSS